MVRLEGSLRGISLFRFTLCVWVVLTARLLAAQGAPPPAPADELTDLALEDLLKVKVYAASRFVQDVAHAPASVSIVTAEEIRRHGYRTIADILRNVRGFYITYDRNYRYVGVRGFARPGDYNSRVLLLLNGHRLNDTIFEQALIGTESPVDVSMVERVEVVRGPSSSLYGTSAFFAVVNVITRSGRSLHGAEVEGGVGSQAWRGGRLAAGGRRASGLEGLVSISGFESGGQRMLYFPEYDTPATNHGVASDADADRGASIYGNATAGGVKMQGGFGSRTKIIPTGAFNVLFNDARAQTRDARVFGDVEYTRRLDPRTTLQTRAAYDDYAYNGGFPYDDGLFRDAARGTWLTAEGSIVRQFAQHGLTVGAEYRDNLRQNQSATDPRGTLLDDRRTSNTAALYAEDEWRLSPRVVLNAGGRWDHYFDSFGGTINPRVGLIVLPREGTALKALYGRAFRAPNPFELYYDQNALSATLMPEHISTYEVVWVQRVGKAVQVMGSAFEYRARDLITQRRGADTIDGLYYQNSDSASAHGVELELHVELQGGVRARVSHTVQSVTDAATGLTLSNSPNVLSNAVVDIPMGRGGFFLGLNAFHVSQRSTILGGTVERAIVADLTLSNRAFAHGVGVSMAIGNLFGSAYADPGSVEHRQDRIPQDGRTAAVRATWRF